MLQTGLNGGFALAAWPGTQGTAANANPAGPSNASEAAFGVTAAGGEGKHTKLALGVLSTGTIALAGLVYLWWSLPR